jgi:23S rRNA pseudouridine2605 synthase
MVFALFYLLTDMQYQRILNKILLSQLFFLYTKVLHIIMKLSKFLATSGHCSRRKATELVKSGFVKVKGVVVYEPFNELKQDDTVKVNNKLIHNQKKLYFLFNKPTDVICTLSDTQDRTIISNFFSHIKERLYPIGRLDRNTTGVLLITNDGELTQKLSHPKFKISKTDQVTTHTDVSEEALQRLKDGIMLEDGMMQVDDATYASPRCRNVVIITIHSGKKHVIKRLFKEIRYFVEKLDRINFAGLIKKGIPRGHYRELTETEVAKLQRL